MSSMIATNLNTLLFALPMFTFKTYTKYRTIVTTITIHSIFLSADNLFASHASTLYLSHGYSLFCSQPFSKR